MNDLTPRYRRVAVLAPSGVQTGGPELLHQLVHEIRSQGGAAVIHYVPDPHAVVPERYRVYDVATAPNFEAEAGDCIVAPETLIRSLRLRSPADRYVWWLSYDFFRSRRSSAAGRFAADVYKKLLVQGLTWSGTKHLFQSHYARHRLGEQNISGDMLSDYLSVEPLADDDWPREDIILYNPKKGLEITERLKAAHPDFTFVPIINMTKADVEATFRRAKVYIDFGEHPGKDRLPREAAMLGTVVVVGRRGAAAFDEDLPLASVYKFDLGAELAAEFGRSMRSIFSDFKRHQAAQAPFRAAIQGERELFSRQVRDVFFKSN